MPNLLGRNRAERRRKATKADAQKFMGQAFSDRIAWTAARHLLVRISSDEAYAALDPELRRSIGTFLARHPLKHPETTP